MDYMDFMEEIEHRLQYERCLYSAVIELNKPGENAVENALHQLLSCSDASRIYIFRNFTDKDNYLAMQQLFEACADKVEPQIDNPKLQHVIYRRDGFERWMTVLSGGKTIYGKIKDFPADEREILEDQGIQSILIIPISVNEGWYGFIGFDDTFRERDWSEDDILLLQTFSRILGSYFERVEAENKLIAKNEQFELAVRGSNDGIWDWNIVTNDLYLSERWKEMLGYRDDEISNTFDSFLRLLHGDDKERVLNHVEEYLQGKHEKYDIEFRMIHKEGGYRWIRARGEVLFGNDGKPYRMAGSHTDITEKNEFEQRLQEREAQFRTIFYHSPQPMTLTELSGGKLIEVNDTFCEKLKVSREDILGKTTTELEFYPPDAREKFTTELVQRGTVDGMEMEFLSLDGSIIVAKMYATFITVNSQNYILTIFDDITEQKKTENALRESEDKFRNFVENANDIVYSLSKEGRFTYVSPNWEDILGHKAEQVVGEKIESFVHPDDLKRCRDFLQRILETGKKQDGIEYRVQHRNGEWRWHMSNASPLKDEKGTVISYIGIARDVTDRKRAEEEMISAKEGAEIANRAKSEFLANMSHEIRTPLNAVIGFSQLLEETPLTPVQKEYADSIGTSAGALLDIINDILDFSKIEAGKLELEYVKTDLYELLEQSIDIIKYTAAKKNLEVLLDIVPEMPRFALVDPIRLKQILANLLSNSVKFTETGEIELKVKFEQRDEGQGDIRFSIRDTGIGINEKQKKKIFKAFTQADSSTTRRFGGTGLGLIISENIAQKMGSHLHLESSPGIGSTFYFTIQTEIEYSDTAAVGRIEDIRRSLVIDDNENNRKILEHMLAAWDIECTSCENGFESLKLIERDGPFDVIICDYHMPYIDGLETIKMIREKLHLTPGKQPVILLHSSSDDLRLHEECTNLGVRWRLTKPVKRKELFQKLISLHDLPPDTEKDKLQQGTPQFPYDGKITILIAEDNDTNMLLTKSIAKKAVPSAKIIEAVNGREAVDLVEKAHPDLVLMDIQMPEMDGNQATAAIREMNRKKGSNPVTVIGLTAGAFKEEKEKSLEAGMDDFITKPIDIKRLQEVVQNYLKKNPAERRETEAEHFDKTAFEADVDDEDVVEEIILHAKQDIPRKIVSLENSLRNNSLEKAAKVVHSIKGTALSMRCSRLAELSNETEQLIRSGSTEEAGRMFEKIKSEWQVLVPLLDLKQK
jgi:PAS domain S-box-containing protein